MPNSIHGPLHAEMMGPPDGRLMVFVHPNPMDSSSWMFQMAHFSTWFRTVAVDLPGYGKSPTASPDVTLEAIGQAIWETAERVGTGPAILVGCSVGSHIVQRMYYLRPDDTKAVVLSGTGYHEVKDFPAKRKSIYQEKGIEYRWEYTFEDFSPSFRGGPLARWFADLFAERNAWADLDTILYMFDATGERDPAWLHSQLDVPVLILTGEFDKAHKAAHELVDRYPDAELVTIYGAGHACNIEAPWQYDRAMLDFLQRRRLY